MYRLLLLPILLVPAAQGAAQQAIPPTELIADVRIDVDADGEPDRLGDTVTVSGRASSGSSTLNRDYMLMFVEDATAGISLFEVEPRADVATGDSIVVTGVVHQHRGLTQLLVIDMRVVRGARRVPAAVELEPPFEDLERYEGRLVRFRAQVKGMEENEFGQIVLAGSPSQLDGIDVFIAHPHSSPPDLTELRVGDDVMLTGLLTQHDFEPPYDAHYQLFPRSEADVRVLGFSRERVENVLRWGALALLLAALWLGVLRMQVRRRTNELRATAHRFEALIENAYEMITVIDGNGRVSFSSRSSEQILGTPVEQRIGSSGFDVVHPDDAETMRRTLSELAAEPRSARSLTWRARHADGSWRTLSSVATNLLDDPDMRGIVVNSRDVTDRAALELQLALTRRLEAIGRVAGGVAHDFNNLITVIRGNAEMLLSEPAADPAVRSGAAEIRAAAQRAASLTGQLLAFGRKQVLRPRVVDLGTVLRGMESLLRRMIGADVRIELRIADDLGRVSADPTQIEQVLMNLAVNARDAMPDGGTLLIELDNATVDEDGAGAPRATPPGSYVRITVRDSGGGIPADALEHIFEPFFTTKNAGRGTGLGLATVYGIVKQSGGHIAVESAPEGTTFRILLPRTERPAEPDPEEATAEPVDASGGGLILLVEDEPGVRAMTERILARAGYDVVSAADGVAALDTIRSMPAPPDLLLTDVVMPHMSGRVLAERVGEILPDTPVLFMSGYTDDKVIQGGIRTGDANFLAKPFTPAQLLHRVGSLMPARSG